MRPIILAIIPPKWWRVGRSHPPGFLLMRQATNLLVLPAVLIPRIELGIGDYETPVIAVSPYQVVDRYKE